MEQSLLEEINGSISALATNILAISRGGGRTDLVVGQIRDAADLLRDYRSVEAEDPFPEVIARALPRHGDA